MDLRKLTRFLDVNGEAEYELDLRGLDLPHSLASIDRMVERQRFSRRAEISPDRTGNLPVPKAVRRCLARSAVTSSS